MSAADDYACPLDVEVERKALEKLNVNASDTQQTLKWMGGVLGQELRVSTFADSIQDGEMLCNLLNAIQPGTVKKIHTDVARNEDGTLKPMSVSKARENVTAFMHGAKALGVPQSSIFDTLDVINKKNLDVIIQCLSMLGRKTGGLNTPGGDASTVQNKLSNVKQSAEVPTIFARNNKSPAAASPIYGNANTASPPVKSPEEMHPNARGGGYGLDAEIADKAAAKFANMAGEKDAIDRWMSAVLGVSVDTSTSLKDGQLLCKFVNTMWPGTIGLINNVTVNANGEFSAPAKFKAQENVTAFIKGAQAVGVPQSCTFDTLDVVESKDLNGILFCLSALGRVSANRSDYSGPQLHAPNDGSRAAQALKAAQQSSTAPGLTIFR